MLDLAEIFCVSKMTISNWVDEGMPRGDRGTYDVRACAAWIEARRKAEVDLRLANLDLDEAERRYRLAKAESAELDLALKKGDLIPVEKVLAIWERHISAAKTKFLAFPSKLAPMLLGAQNRLDIHNILGEEVRNLLEDLAGGGSRNHKRTHESKSRTSKGKA
jgi:phage terminase Nu1 subunit (DNA packaging protein)